MSLPSDAFLSLLEVGLSVIPVRQDKRPMIDWKNFQERHATLDDVNVWDAFNPPGVAIVCGKVSGGVVCIDIDEKHDPEKIVAREYFALLKEWGAESIYKRCVIEKTPSGGYHVAFRAPFAHGNEKLAKAYGKVEAMIETRGEGGYFVCAPTPGWVLSQSRFEDIPTLTDDEANLMLSAAWAMDRNDAPASEPVERVQHEGKSPFDDFNDRVTSDEILEMLSAHGWRKTGQRGPNIHLCRPDKSGRHTSATLHEGKRTFYAFTSSTQFEQRKAYSPVGVYAVLECGGDFKTAARELVRKGYGEKRVNGEHKPERPKTFAAVAKADTLADEVLSLYRKPFYPGESTGWLELDQKFRVEKGQMNILFGIPSHGKSSFMDAMLVNLVRGSRWKAVVFSPENKTPAYHASKLCEIVTGRPMYGQGRVTEDELYKAAQWVQSWFTFLTPSEYGTTLEDVLDKVKALRPDIAVLDPWNRLDHSRPAGMTETDYIGACLAKTSNMVKMFDISFWFVVHPQKLRRGKEGEIIRPGFYEIHGSAHWANMSDNGILVWRDFKADLTEIETVKVRYRHNGSPGVVRMKFDRPSGRFAPLSSGEIARIETERIREEFSGALPSGDR